MPAVVPESLVSSVLFFEKHQWCSVSRALPIQSSPLDRNAHPVPQNVGTSLVLGPNTNSPPKPVASNTAFAHDDDDDDDVVAVVVVVVVVVVMMSMNVTTIFFLTMTHRWVVPALFLCDLRVHCRLRRFFCRSDSEAYAKMS